MSKQSFTTGQVLTAAQVNSLQANDFNQTVSVKTANYTLAAADKGTRIEFNTSGSVTCTVNSGLFDAGDTLVIQNRGAGTATITAGTATVNTSASLALTQYSAGTLYFVSDSAAIFFGDAAGISASIVDAKGDLIVGTADNTVGRLAVGTDGYTLVADSSTATGLAYAAPAAGSGLVCIKAETAFSAVSSFTEDSIFSSTYTNYLLVMRFTTSTTNNPSIQLRASGSTAATNYNVQFFEGLDTTTAATRTTGATAATIFRSTNGAFQSLASLQISGPYLAEPTMFAIQTAGSNGAYTSPVSQANIGNHSTATSYDGFIVSVSTGTFSGIYTLYGYSKVV